MSCFKFLKKKNSYEFQHPYFEKESGVYRSSQIDLQNGRKENKSNDFVVSSGATTRSGDVVFGNQTTPVINGHHEARAKTGSRNSSSSSSSSSSSDSSRKSSIRQEPEALYDNDMTNADKVIHIDELSDRGDGASDNEIELQNLQEDSDHEHQTIHTTYEADDQNVHHTEYESNVETQQYNDTVVTTTTTTTTIVTTDQQYIDNDRYSTSSSEHQADDSDVHMSVQDSVVPMTVEEHHEYSTNYQSEERRSSSSSSSSQSSTENDNARNEQIEEARVVDEIEMASDVNYLHDEDAGVYAEDREENAVMF